LKTLLTSIILLFSTIVVAQNGIIRGNIYDKDTAEPIMFASVFLRGSDLGANTDLDGFFSIADVPPGEYELKVTYVGYDSLIVNIKMEENRIVQDQYFLTPSEGIQLATVNVSARKERSKTQVQVSTLSVTADQIRAIPATGGEPDIAQYLPVLPGIVSTGDQGGQLYIRGGSPIQNKILLDGMTIYNPFHSIGFFSVFETEIIKNVDVLTGGFGAENGGRVSAIVDISTREGNRKRFGGLVSASPFQVKGLVEGPLIKLKEEGGGSASFLLTAKQSLIDRTDEIFFPYAEPALNDTLGLPFSYTDIYGKMSFLTENGSKFNAFGFNFKDRVNFGSIADLNWNTNGGGMNFTVIPPNANIVVGGNLAASNYSIGLVEEDGNRRTSGITNYNVNLDFTYYGNKNEVKYGFGFNGIETDFRFRNFLGNTIDQEDFTTEIFAFIKYRQIFGRLILEPSVRFQYYASQNKPLLEPRLGAKFNATDDLRFKFAGGLYSQNLVSSVNERDIVNLFVGFLTGPEETIFVKNTDEVTNNNLQQAVHGIAGFEYDLTKQVEFNVEAYYKGFTQLISLNRNKLSADEPDFSTESGEAYGIDFSMRYSTEQLYVWTTYSLGYVNRDDGEQIYPTIFDRRHNVNFLTTYNFGETRDWEASVRWNFGTGFPFTQTQGFYSNYNFLDSGLDTDPLGGNADLGLIFSDDRNGGRLPTYHRLDLSLKRSFKFNKYTSLDAIASITNAYNRQNIFFFDRVEYERVNQLPILPSLGLTLKF